ncbi:MAG: ATP-binding protein [Chlamydiae bacterium]|nr:ATP-binding protein [Chlamydiota bacterium]MBI3277681.1 ATP-binding protein [Chlamydiota bacterium]
MIRRIIELPSHYSYFLFGPRQTGKSTLLKALYSQDDVYIYDLLKSEECRRLQANPELFREQVLARNPRISHIIVDEIQKIPILLSEVHFLMESPNPPIFILTGSSARKLKRSKADLLAGRALTYHLFPLSFEELVPNFSLSKALQFGTLPKVYLEKNEALAMDILRSYVETYLREEIEIEAQMRRLDSFIRFLSLAAFENGNILNFSNLARETGTSYQTIKSYFQILEDTLMGFFLFPYSKSERKKLVKHPKFYFFDTGVTRALTKRVSIPIDPHTPEFGMAFEHFIILEIMRLSHYKKMDLSFSFYRTESGTEVDLIIQTPRGEIKAIEIKSSDRVDSSHLRGLRSFKETCPEAKLCCISLNPKPSQQGDVKILPWQDVMEWIQS